MIGNVHVDPDGTMRDWTIADYVIESLAAREYAANVHVGVNPDVDDSIHAAMDHATMYAAMARALAMRP